MNNEENRPLDECEVARQKFMRGEISAAEYWDIRKSYWSQFKTSNNNKNNQKEDRQ